MKEQKEISIEDYSVGIDTVYIAYYEHNDFKELRVPTNHLESYVTDNGLLDWVDIVMKNNELVDQHEGVWEFSEYIKDRLDLHTIKKFLISELQKMKS